ncbi:unnamed protein product [Rangifer tarandus platyrhynchus]|uniref:Uncharacterized protein n=2 Tax=Rangifer tarandus platyrhynchus TaxID=3082113 RepID=A0ACB0EY85_RANTA|nr:unnamed protein product [Rangifer tarandus platyrhynchus]CAI9705675.1 unnamed protein product [Rangifer tarandus platyrhynchus]
MASGYPRTNHLFEHATKKSALSRAEARQAQLRPGEARPGGGAEAARLRGLGQPASFSPLPGSRRIRDEHY